jgi:peptidoglycan/xylan/chitin deacetylase (PgdA/CDA1 family)
MFKKVSKQYAALIIILAAGSLVWGATGLLYYYFSPPSEEFLKYFSGHGVPQEAAPTYFKNRLPIAEKIQATNTKSVRVPILVYHSVKNYSYGASKKDYAFNVTPTMFEKHLKYLKGLKYDAVSIEAIANHFEKNIPLPEKPVAITFDDGWETQYENALPILKKYKYNATFFITTDDIGKKDFLNWRQVAELAATGMEIGSHTKSHPFLTDIGDEELRKELAESKSIVEEKIKKSVSVFAYPFGRYDANAVSATERTGYRAARTTDAGSVHKQTELLNLRGNLVFNNMDGFKAALVAD